MNYSITPQERTLLRELAKKQLEYAMLPAMKQKTEQWTLHNDLKGDVPMIHVETWTFSGDIFPELKCTSETARKIEWQLLEQIVNYELIQDDRVVPPYFFYNWQIHRELFNLPIKTAHASNSSGNDLGHQFLHQITDLPKDLPTLQKTNFSVDREETLRWKGFVEDLLGDILPVKLSMHSLNACLSQDIVHLMGMENMIYSIVDYPDEFQAFIKMISDDYIAFFKWMEQEKLLAANNTYNGVGNGTFGFSNVLPGKTENLTTHDCWGFMDSQETISISPEMFGEFFFPYYEAVGKLFGLLSYGCCEPVHNIWEPYLSKLPHIRKVSISPWCDEEFMGEALRGSDVIYHRKPSPNFVGVGSQLDEEAFSQHLTKTLKAAAGCKLEFSFRDIYSLGGDKSKPRRAVQILRDLIEKHWKP